MILKVLEEKWKNFCIWLGNILINKYGIFFLLDTIFFFKEKCEGEGKWKLRVHQRSGLKVNYKDLKTGEIYFLKYR